ncbi:MAG: CHAT domain-containing protein [bacterium]|nr:CHAT domain-containing protein [bacterium]
MALRRATTLRAAAQHREEARVASDGGAHAEALEHLDACVRLHGEVGAFGAIAHDHRLRGDAFTWLGRPVAALSAYEAATEVATEHGLAPPVPAAQLGAWYAWFGRYEEARALLDEALVAAAADPAARARVLSTLATLESARGRYADALRLLDRSLAASREAGDSAAEGATLVLKGGMESELGRAAAAEDTIRAGLERLDPARMPIQCAYAWMQIGLARIDAGRPADALPLLDRARDAFAASDFAVGRAEVLQHRARALLDLDQLESAEAAWEAAAELRQRGRNPFHLALARTGLGDARERLGDLAGARAAYSAAIAAAAEVDTPEAHWRASYGFGRVLERDGAEAEALVAYRGAIESVESIRTSLESPAMRLAFLADKLGLYRRTARLCARAGELDAAFEWSEAAKARTLLERFRVDDTTQAADGSGARARLARAESALALVEIKASSALRASPSAEVQADFGGRLAAARAAHTEASRAFARAAPRRAHLSGEAESPSLATVCARLTADTAVVEYLLDAEFGAAFILRREGASFIELDVTSADVDAWSRSLRAPIDALREGRTSITGLGFDVRASRSAYDALVLPLADELEGCREVWIVPDDVLWRLPFAALSAQREPRRIDPREAYVQHRGTRFWVEDVALGVLPCAGLLVADRARPETDPRPPLLFADPQPLPQGGRALAAARDEIDTVAAALHADRPRSVHGTEATERAAKRALAGASWAHFAVHGELNDTAPAYSRLVLAPGAGEDGYLHAFEVENLELRADHIVLSACETAGSAGAGEGMLGLPRAFLIAGARSVLATGWTLDDAAAAELMRRYYAALAAGEREPAALRTAQIGMLREAGREGLSYAHPFFWAGFVLVGTP